jgi:dCTP deaminase
MILKNLSRGTKGEKMEFPWTDWIPGVLNRKQLRQLCDEGLITGVENPDKAVDLSSIDLCLSDSGYEMREGSVKPSPHPEYKHLLQNTALAKKLVPATDGSFLLSAKCTYVFMLKESLSPRLLESKIYGQATAKSSVGRVDVLARLIVDGMDTYEGFEPRPKKHPTGALLLEITPITFDVRVKPGIPLTQLRLFYGHPQAVRLESNELYETVLQGPGAADGSLTVHLENENIGGLTAAAFCAVGKAEGSDPIQLWDKKKTNPCKHWRLKEATGNRLKIEKEIFYILRSKEKIAVPAGIAVYCRASDETIGEMRIHYAGFVHPWFGRLRADGQKGTPLIFEVRGHQVNVNLTDGEMMAKLRFYRMSADAEKPNGSEYGNQTLKLSSFFADWPEKLKRNEDDTVEEIKA